MEYGIQLATSAHHWKVVKRAEEMGFTHAWFYDTELLNADVFVAMAAAAMQTSRIKLCTGVLIPSNRIAPVAASALASLNALAPGRIVCALSTGFTARRTLGLPAVTLKRLEDYIRVVRGLLARETVEWSEEGGPHKIRFLNPELGLINLDDPIPFHISAFGPKGRALAAKLGTGWMIGGNPRGAAAALGAMREEWQKAGREPKDLYSTTFGNGCVLADGEAVDSPRARAQAGPSATMMFHDLAEQEELGTLGFRLPPQFQPILDAYREIYRRYEPADARYLSNHRGHLMFLRPEEQALVTPELLRTLTYTGTEAEMVAAVRQVKEAGFSQFAVTLRVGHEFEMLADWAKVLEKV
ncbi:MAG TPA: LLM class flavin-dependent oxidoreductase [Stellaceae bacterium]|nr:LLM class flavin-dependent oxidoreductase [Stellaceae bacterium]